MRRALHREAGQRLAQAGAPALQIADDAVLLADQSPGRLGHRYPVHIPRGYILVALDRLDEARTTIETGRRISEEHGIRWPLASYHAVRAFERFIAGYGNQDLGGVVRSRRRRHAHRALPDPRPRTGDDSPPATITQFVLHHHAAILATAWLQGFGPFPYVLFALGVVYLAGAMTRLAGWVTLLASAVILTLSLIDAAFTISAAEAVAHGHAVTASASFDLIDGPGNDAAGRVFLIAPPLLLPLGAVLLGSQLLPRAFGYTAVAFGGASIILGLAALFSPTAFSLAIILIIAESAWVLAAAGALVIWDRANASGWGAGHGSG